MIPYNPMRYLAITNLETKRTIYRIPKTKDPDVAAIAEAIGIYEPAVTARWCFGPSDSPLFVIRAISVPDDKAALKRILDRVFDKAENGA